MVSIFLYSVAGYWVVCKRAGMRCDPSKSDNRERERINAMLYIDMSEMQPGSHLIKILDL